MSVSLGILDVLLLAFAHLVVVALDVALLFLVVRALTTRWRARRLVRLDAIGAPLLDPIFSALQRIGRPSREVSIFAVSIGLCAARFIVTAIALSLVGR